LITVGEYRCLPLSDAQDQIVAQGFTVGDVGTNPAGLTFDDTWLVHAQVPTPGEQRPPGTPIRLTVQDPTQPCP
jgi:hypothetical protein